MQVQKVEKGVNIYKVSEVASKVLSDLLGYQVEIRSEQFTLGVEHDAEPSHMTLVVKMPIKKVSGTLPQPSLNQPQRQVESC